MAVPSLPRTDLDEVLIHGEDDLRALAGARIFLTGGTGFVGTWLTECLLHAEDQLGLGLRLVLLTRDAPAYRSTRPHLAGHRAVELVTGDVRQPIAVEGAVDAMVHAATPASATFNDQQPRAMVETIVDGMQHALDLAVRSGPIPLLFTSSGAVYGRQPTSTDRVDEGYLGGPDPLDPRAAYHEGKRLAELLGAIESEAGRCCVKVARLFAFVGPLLPIDAHFTAGNFVRDALAGGPIVVGGDGTPLRSYLYGTDLVIWLLRVLLRAPAARAYNVGSEDAVSIAELARLTAAAAGSGIHVEVRGTPDPARRPERYVPSTTRAREELGLVQHVSLPDALVRTIAWHRDGKGAGRSVAS